MAEMPAPGGTPESELPFIKLSPKDAAARSTSQLRTALSNSEMARA